MSDNLISVDWLINYNRERRMNSNKPDISLDMLPYSVLVSHGHNKYQLDIDRKITVIQDNSGNCKTLLYKSIYGKKDNGVKISGNIVAVNSVTDMIEYSEEADVFIIDEDSRCFDRNNGLFIKYLKEDTTHLFILITRDASIKWLPYSPDDIYVMYRSNGISKLRHKYGSPLYSTKTLNIINTCYIEDKTTGLSFFRKTLRVKTETFDGKSNWSRLRGINNILFIFDRCGFGSEYGAFCAYMNMVNSTVSVLDYESFEWLLLFLIGVDIPDVRLFYNKEDAYTNELKRYFKDYRKTDDCKCSNEGCYSCSRLNKSCDYDREASMLFSLFKKSDFGKYLKSIL